MIRIATSRHLFDLSRLHTVYLNMITDIHISRRAQFFFVSARAVTNDIYIMKINFLLLDVYFLFSAICLKYVNMFQI